MKKNNYKILFSAVMILALFSMNGQSLDQGQAYINDDSRIENLLELHKQYNELFPQMQGYRIQIFMESGNEALNQANEVKAAFNEKYPDIPAYLLFTAPYYRVRTGDFRTRLEAEKALDKIRRNYPNAWVIQDDINFPSLGNNQKTYDHE